ncbi:MAG: glycine cleavage system aminomethyltransferase GcvT [Actinobacteria bacterium]|uniref:aminomethyltransferase n=1 Tax=freshwater metagenome TaxID=449393 RepID=A0A6J6NJP8_9ZZZZ|nr:glycine cleavage system aminomethyltransferase GcvT [Actinomycetota bacterium]
MPQTPLHAEHARLGASFTDFGGWDMPVRYSSDLAEHQAVRESAGLFDISHMAEIFVSGPQAASFLDYALVGQASAIAIGKAKYSLICNAQGNIIDDLIVYRLQDDQFLVIANAGNRAAVVEALEQRALFQGFVGVTDNSDDFALLAIQGPKATSILQTLTDTDLSTLPYYSIGTGKVAGVEAYLCRTGYTGEDGFEILFNQSHATDVFNALISAGAIPCGLASRDTLRLEAGMPLYGHELSLDINPYEAGLGRVVKLDRDEDFVGKSALAVLSTKTPAKQLVGLVGEGKRAARAEYEVFADGDQAIGHITSGALSPTLGYPVAMAYVATASSEVGTNLSVDIRGTRLPMTVVKLPFYKRSK